MTIVCRVVQGFDLRHRSRFKPVIVILLHLLIGEIIVLREFELNLVGVLHEIVNDLVERFQADLSRKCREYSSGNRQKVGLIQAFMHEPELVILDEPSAGLDPLVQQSLHELMAELRSEGRTVFLSSHTLSEVDRVADRVGIIRQGKLVEVASMADLKAVAIRHLDLEFTSAVDTATLSTIDGVTEVSGDEMAVRVSFEGSIQPILAEATRLGVVNLHSSEAELEEIFLNYYRDDAAQSTEGTPDVSE